MSDERRGRYRTVTAHGAQYVWVSTGPMGGEDVPEAAYRAAGTRPPIEELPLKTEYEVAALPDDASDGTGG